MPASFTVEFKGDHIEVHSDGDKDLAFARRLWSEIVETIRKHDCYRVLGLANTTTPVNIIDGFDHAEMMRELGLAPRSRIAWVEPDPKSFEVVKFIETVLFNRSIAVMKVFRSERLAREWLFSEQGV